MTFSDFEKRDMDSQILTALIVSMVILFDLEWPKSVQQHVGDCFYRIHAVQIFPHNSRSFPP